MIANGITSRVSGYMGAQCENQSFMTQVKFSQHAMKMTYHDGSKLYCTFYKASLRFESTEEPAILIFSRDVALVALQCGISDISK